MTTIEKSFQESVKDVLAIIPTKLLKVTFNSEAKRVNLVKYNFGNKYYSGNFELDITGYPILYGRGIFEDSVGYYMGDLVDGQPHGYGKMMYNNHDVYTGEWKQGKRHGKGSQYYTSGYSYDGDWLDGMRHGIGKIISSHNNETCTWQFDRRC